MSHNLDATVFVFTKDGETRAEYLDGARVLERDASWLLVATLEPRLWIQAHYATIENVKTATQAVS